MNERTEQAASLRDAFDRIEEAYEFMLAYAAQGRSQEVQDGGGESQIRQYLKHFEAALADMDRALSQGLGDDGAFTERVRGDVATAQSIVGLLLQRRSVSSSMVDNTNGLIALRALLTDIFFIDQAVLPER